MQDRHGELHVDLFLPTGPLRRPVGLVHVLGQSGVKFKFGRIVLDEVPACHYLTLQEQIIPLEVHHLFFQPPQHQGATALAVPMSHDGRVVDAGVQQLQQLEEILRVALVGRGRRQHQMLALSREYLPQAIRLGAVLFVGGQVVRLIDDHQVPVDVVQRSLHISLPGEMHRGDDLRAFHPDIRAGLQFVPPHDIEMRQKLLLQLTLPLHRQ